MATISISWVCSIPSQKRRPGAQQAAEQLILSVAQKYGFSEIWIRFVLAEVPKVTLYLLIDIHWGYPSQYHED